MANQYAWLEEHPAVDQQQPGRNAAMLPEAEQAQAPDYSWLQEHPAVDTSKPIQAPVKSDQTQPWYSGALDDTIERQGAGTAAVRAVGDGLTFGFQDEILAGLDAAAQPFIPQGNGSSADSFGQRYEDNLANQRARLKAGQEQHPVTSIAGGVVGGVLPAAATGGASLGAAALGAAGRQTTGRAVATGAATGAAYGGAYGLGSADGDLGDRVGGAVSGGLLGGLVGGAVPGVIGAVKGAKNAIANPEVRAQRQLDRALDRDGLTRDQFRNQFDDLASRNPDTAIPADAGGENVAGLVERLANTPGEARTTVVDTLTNRSLGQGQRIGQSLKGLTGVNKSAYQAKDDVVAERARAAAPLYAQAYKEEVPWGPDLESLINRPAMQTAYEQARTRAANQGRTFDGTFVEFTANGKAVPRSVPRTGDLDVIKQGLDDQIESLLGSNKKSQARDVIGIKNELLGIMDASAPTYRQARASFAGHSEYLNAIDNGEQLLKRNKTSEQWAAEMSRMNESEKEAVRIGAVSSILSQIGNDSSKMPDITKYLRSPEGRAKIDLLMPSDAARKDWANRVAQESNVSRLTNRATGNSSTARRQAEIDDADELIVDMAGTALTAGTAGILITMLRTLPRKAGDRINERSNRIMAKALTSRDGLDALNGVNPRAMVGRALPAAAGVLAGQGGAASQNRRNEPARRREARRQVAMLGYYPSKMAASAALREEGMRDGYEAVEQPGSGAWAIRPKGK